MSYQIVVSSKAEKDMLRLPVQDREKIVAKIEQLGEDPRPSGCIKLKGRSEEL